MRRSVKVASNAEWLLPERLKPIVGAITQSPSAAPIRATIEDYRTSTAAFISNHSRVTKDLQDDGRWSETQVGVYNCVDLESFLLHAVPPAYAFSFRLSYMSNYWQSSWGNGVARFWWPFGQRKSNIRWTHPHRAVPKPMQQP